MSQHPLLPPVSGFTANKQTLIVCPSMSIRTRVLRKLKAEAAQVSLLYDAIPLFASESALVLGPLIGAPAARIAVEPFLVDGTIEQVVFIGSVGGLSFGPSELSIGTVLAPSFFRVRNSYIRSSEIRDFNPTPLQRQLHQVLATSAHPQLEGGVISLDSPFEESVEYCQQLFQEGLLGVDLECAALAELCEKYRTAYAALLIISDIISPLGSSGFKKREFLHALDKVLPALDFLFSA